MREAEALAIEQTGQTPEQYDQLRVLSDLEEEMLACASDLQFERAAVLRDQINTLRAQIHPDALKSVSYKPATRRKPRP